MIISFQHRGCQFEADLSKPMDLSIPLKPGEDNPNCYWAEPMQLETIVMGDFIGSVAQGGPVNYQQMTITPHGNGTHTECYGHIVADEGGTISDNLHTSHFVCQLMSLEPTKAFDDAIITFDNFKKKWTGEQVPAVVIRTLPNNPTKLTRKYSGTNPPYLDDKITAFLNEQGVKHLIVDLPSIDREQDGGKLLAHKAFFGVPGQVRKEATITELAYIENTIEDGLYLLNLQTINLAADACPSRPVLYEIVSF